MSNELNKKTGSKLRSLRKAHGYTQRYIASKLNLSEAAVSYIESGKNKLDPEHAQKLADLYGISIDLLYRDDEKLQQENEALFRSYKVFFDYLRELGIRIETETRKHPILDEDGIPIKTGAFNLELMYSIVIKKKRYVISAIYLEKIKRIIEEQTFESLKNCLQLLTDDLQE